MKRYILWSFIAILLVGCGVSSNYFLISPLDTKLYHSKKLPTIGVEKISLPQYLQQNRVVVQLSPTQVSYRQNDIWAEDMEESLTKQLITKLQKSFNHPYVYAYPWNLSKQAGLKVKVSISRFIAYGDHIYLDANWEIYNIDTQKSVSRLFSVKVPTTQDTTSIVSNMSRAFDNLSSTITQEINRKF